MGFSALAGPGGPFFPATPLLPGRPGWPCPHEAGGPGMPRGPTGPRFVSISRMKLLRAACKLSRAEPVQSIAPYGTAVIAGRKRAAPALLSWARRLFGVAPGQKPRRKRRLRGPTSEIAAGVGWISRSGSWSAPRRHICRGWRRAAGAECAPRPIAAPPRPTADRWRKGRWPRVLPWRQPAKGRQARKHPTLRSSREKGVRRGPRRQTSCDRGPIAGITAPQPAQRSSSALTMATRLAIRIQLYLVLSRWLRVQAHKSSSRAADSLPPPPELSPRQWAATWLLSARSSTMCLRSALGPPNDKGAIRMTVTPMSHHRVTVTCL